MPKYLVNFLSAKEAATVWGVTERTIHKWCKFGRWKGKAKNSGDRWYIPRDVVYGVD